jgi:hypothetical protein
MHENNITKVRCETMLNFQTKIVIQNVAYKNQPKLNHICQT